MSSLRYALQRLLRGADPGARVFAHLTIRGEGSAGPWSVEPDLFVARGLEPRRYRRAFHLAEERGAPELIIEVATCDTIAEDVEWKRRWYCHELRVTEYLVIDLDRALDHGPLVSWRRSSGHRGASTSTRFQSEVVPCVFRLIDGFVRVVDLHGALVPGTSEEAEEAARREAVHLALERFGQLPDPVRELVASASGDRLARAFRAAFSATSLDAFLREL